MPYQQVNSLSYYKLHCAAELIVDKIRGFIKELNFNLAHMNLIYIHQSTAGKNKCSLRKMLVVLFMRCLKVLTTSSLQAWHVTDLWPYTLIKDERGYALCSFTHYILC